MAKDILYGEHSRQVILRGVDLVKAGVIDPAKVVRTEALISETA